MPVNTAALKTFAPAMRRQLLEAVGRKLDLLLTSQTPDTLSTYAKQIAELREQEAQNRDQLLERVAYTWFNRLCALRYLDARGWHPFGCKVLMPAAEGETQPELLKLMRAGNLPAGLQGHADESRLHGLLDCQIQTAIAGADPQGEVYRELVLATCRLYHELLPNLFEGLDDATELLLPDDLLTEGSIAGSFRSEISDDDCESVEIIGWLYQFYISEKKDAVMARKKAVPPDDIPAVTQLFTPHWIVRYLVENCLGRLWLLNRPGSKLREHMPYYIEGDAETDFLVINRPEEIKLLDPACGSGHMLTYAFDLLVLIYEEEGYAPNEIPGLILRHNLHGLEICHRAAQLAQFALVCKAREQSRTAFRRPVQPHVMCLQNVVLTPEEMQAWSSTTGERLTADEFSQLHQFRENTDTYGALIKPVLDGRKLVTLAARVGEQAPAGDLLVQITHRKLRLVLEQAEMLSQRYQVVVANPPYMGRSQMGASLKAFVSDRYECAKHNLFSAFILREIDFCIPFGITSIVTMQNWMFLSRFADFRAKLRNCASIKSVVHLGARAFESIGGEVVQTVAFAFRPGETGRETKTTFIRLIESESASDKKSDFLTALRNNAHDHRVFRRAISEFDPIEERPLCYWASDSELEAFRRLPTLGSIMTAREGMATGSNDIFLRLWHEIAVETIDFDCDSAPTSGESGCRWFPYNKGGGKLRWFGNNDYVVDWEGDGFRIKNFKDEETGRIRSHNYNGEYSFREGLTWSSISSSLLCARYSPRGFLFDAKGTTAFLPGDPKIQLGLLNSVVGGRFVSLLSPTLDIKIGHVLGIPLVAGSGDIGSLEFSKHLVRLARADWDNCETSWDFRDLPLLRPGDWEVEPGHSGGEWKGRTLANSWAHYASYCGAAIKRMQALETENNHLWIDAYGLQDELNPTVPEDEITLARAEVRQDIAGFLSYASGCMMGRYSLDHPGLILADSRDSQAEQLAAYEDKVDKPLSEVQFKPDPDGIIPVLDGEWFEDDIVARTREFLAVTFPESSVGENLRFIEESLGKDIRKYFCSEFYKDHLQTYKKRPIYWLVQSPKKGFACLIYLHRYTKDTLNQVLNNYFRPYLQKLEARLAQLEQDQINDDLPTRERTAARKEAEKIAKVLKECQAWEQDALLPLAQQRIPLDLDDGVKVNYLKLQDVLAPIPGLAAKED